MSIDVITEPGPAVITAVRWYCSPSRRACGFEATEDGGQIKLRPIRRGVENESAAINRHQAHDHEDGAIFFFAKTIDEFESFLEKARQLLP